ncbi:hypothetical protein HJ009_22680 [Vibrio parahaemolyticus]|nr:hypothetical protein [Vibrio parahaemolyticus]
MSLTQDIANMVQAANNLTSEVVGKMTQIDQKVDQAVSDLNNAFPSKYQEFSERTHYVSLSGGSDSNDGKSWSSAFKTFKAALDAGKGALSQTIYLSEGVHIINERLYPRADTVTVIGNNQSHYPSGNYSDATSTVLHIDKTTDIRTGLVTKLFGSLYMNMCIYRFEGQADNSSVENCAFYGLGNIGLRLPLFVFDSVNRGVMTAGNNFNPFSSLGAELPQFNGEPAYYVKGNGSTCILNLDRAVDRTTGMQQKSGSVVVLS